MRTFWLFLLLFASPACAESLITSLSTSRVEITSNYSGASIVLFGSIERDAQTIARSGNYAVTVTVRGPRQSLVIREKEKMGPLWINRTQQKFVEVPVYLTVLSSHPLDAITTPELRDRLRIGLHAILYSSDFTLDLGEKDNPFRDALVRIKSRENLYSEHEKGVTFLGSSLFRAPIPLPATAPPGIYSVETLLFIDDTLLARELTSFELAKIGFEQNMAKAARESPLFYGLATACMAVFLGWVASSIFRRD